MESEQSTGIDTIRKQEFELSTNFGIKVKELVVRYRGHITNLKDVFDYMELVSPQFKLWAVGCIVSA